MNKPRSRAVAARTREPVLPVSQPPMMCGVQYLRGIAAFLIVTTHACTMADLPHYFQREVLGGFFRGGAISVPLFFVVSGFIMPYVTLQAGSAVPLLKANEFLWRRFLRVLPFLWICVTGYAILQFIGRGKFDLLTYLRTMVVSPVGDLAPTVVWTLRYEILFYGLYALTLSSRFGRVGQLLLCGWFLAPLVSLWWHPVEVNTASSPLLAMVTNSLNEFFLIGFVAGHCFIRGYWPWRLEAAYSPVILLMLCLLLVAQQHLKVIELPGHRSAWDPTSCLLFALVIVVAVSIRPPVHSTLVHRLAMKLGDVSYALYLSHTAVISASYGVLVKLDHTATLWPSMLIVVVLSLAASIWLHDWIETPLLRVLHRRRQSIPVYGRSPEQGPRALRI